MAVVEKIALKRIIRNPEQPRKLFDPEKLAELRDSIKENGLLQPVVVRPAGGGKFELVMGERRWRACTELKLAEITSVIVDSDDEDAFIKGVAENVNRENMTVMEEARAYAKVMSFGKTVEETACLFGKSPAAIQWRLGFLTLIDEAADALDAGFILPEFGAYVAKLSPLNQQVAVRRYIKGEFKDESTAHAFAHGLLAAEQQGPGFFEVEELTDEQRETKQKAIQKAKADVDRIEQAAGLLADMAKLKPSEMADLFAGEVGVQLDKLDRLHGHLMEARKRMKKARGISEARVYAVREEAAPPAEKAAPEPAADEAVEEVAA